jgi:hypothetical protein
MKKYNARFHCWVISPGDVLVIANCTVTHELLVMRVWNHGSCLAIVLDKEIKVEWFQVPCKFQGIPAIMRARIRARFHEELITHYGREAVAFPPYHWRETQ